MTAKSRRLMLAAAFGIACASHGGVSLAQQRSTPRQDSSPASASAAPSTPLPGTQVFIGAEAGYDTNLDQRVAKRESRYEMLQGGLSSTYKASDAESYSLYLRGRNYTYNDLDLSHRYDIDAALGARYDWSKSTSLKLGTSWLRDAVPINKYDSYRSFADLVNEGEQYRLRIKLDSRTDVSFRKDEVQGALDPDVFSVSRSRAFDYSKNGSTVSLVMLRQQMFAPFVIGNYTNIDYFHQDPNPAIDRRANEYWGVAGVRVTLSPSFYVDLGGRYNYRDFEDPLITRHTSASFDGRFTWKLTPAWTFNGVIERQNKEPTTSFGMVDDVMTYELSTRYRSGQWTLFGRTFLDHVKPVGDNFNYYKYYWSTGAIYELTKSTDLYADYLGRYTTDKIYDEQYDRHRVGGGVRIKF
ncbi:MAG: outer membrane beta-barrel protein [Hyphomicrobiaceae bacterium]